MQGAALLAASILLGYVTHQTDLYVSAGLTLLLKVMLIPWILFRVIRQLNVKWDVETLINIPTTMLVGIALVIFSFGLALPISRLSSSVAGGSLGIALACVLLSFMMMITRSKAIPQHTASRNRPTRSASSRKETSSSPMTALLRRSTAPSPPASWR